MATFASILTKDHLVLHCVYLFSFTALCYISRALVALKLCHKARSQARGQTDTHNIWSEKQLQRFPRLSTAIQDSNHYCTFHWLLWSPLHTFATIRRTWTNHWIIRWSIGWPQQHILQRLMRLSIATPIAYMVDCVSAIVIIAVHVHPHELQDNLEWWGNDALDTLEAIVKHPINFRAQPHWWRSIRSCHYFFHWEPQITQEASPDQSQHQDFQPNCDLGLISLQTPACERCNQKPSTKLLLNTSHG